MIGSMNLSTWWYASLAKYREIFQHCGPISECIDRNLLKKLKPTIIRSCLRWKDTHYKYFVGDKGDQGLRGFPGAQGPQGYHGPPGPEGGSGRAGARGSEGPRGMRGEQGVSGPRGFPGSKGSKGEIGQPGPPGVTTIQSTPTGTGTVRAFIKVIIFLQYLI